MIRDDLSTRDRTQSPLTEFRPPVTQHRGEVDCWLAGEPVEGVTLELHARVRILEGRYAGQTGWVAFLMSLENDPLYLVELTAGTGDVRVPQSTLQRLR